MNDLVVCEHEGAKPVILETVTYGGMTSLSPRCPNCGFRSMAVLDDDDCDITDRYVVAEVQSTWAEWYRRD